MIGALPPVSTAGAVKLTQVLGLSVLIGGARLVYHVTKPHKSADDWLKIASFTLNLGIAYYALRELSA